MTPLDAIEGILRECFRGFAVLPDAHILRDDDVFSVMTEVPLTFFNGVAMSRLNAGRIDDEVAAVIAPYKEARRPFRWWITPSTEPRNLTATLQQHGMRYGWPAGGMMTRLDGTEFIRPEPDGIAIRHVHTLDDFLPPFTAGFQIDPAAGPIWRDTYERLGLDEDSPWQFFVAYADEKPVATTALLLAGELAGIYHVVTLPDFRGRGIGAAITSAAMQYGRARGATTAVLQASEMGAPIYRSLGFIEYCRMEMWEWKG